MEHRLRTQWEQAVDQAVADDWFGHLGHHDFRAGTLRLADAPASGGVRHQRAPQNRPWHESAAYLNATLVSRIQHEHDLTEAAADAARDFHTLLAGHRRDHPGHTLEDAVRDNLADEFREKTLTAYDTLWAQVGHDINAWLAHDKKNDDTFTTTVTALDAAARRQTARPAAGADTPVPQVPQTPESATSSAQRSGDGMVTSSPGHTGPGTAESDGVSAKEMPPAPAPEQNTAGAAPADENTTRGPSAEQAGAQLQEQLRRPADPQHAGRTTPAPAHVPLRSTRSYAPPAARRGPFVPGPLFDARRAHTGTGHERTELEIRIAVTGTSAATRAAEVLDQARAGVALRFNRHPDERYVALRHVTPDERPHLTLDLTDPEQPHDGSGQLLQQAPQPSAWPVDAAPAHYADLIGRYTHLQNANFEQAVLAPLLNQPYTVHTRTTDDGTTQTHVHLRVVRPPHVARTGDWAAERWSAATWSRLDDIERDLDRIFSAYLHQVGSTAGHGPVSVTTGLVDAVHLNPGDAAFRLTDIARGVLTPDHGPLHELLTTLAGADAARGDTDSETLAGTASRSDGSTLTGTQNGEKLTEGDTQKSITDIHTWPTSLSGKQGEPSIRPEMPGAQHVVVNMFHGTSQTDPAALRQSTHTPPDSAVEADLTNTLNSTDLTRGLSPEHIETLRTALGSRTRGGGGTHTSGENAPVQFGSVFDTDPQDLDTPTTPTPFSRSSTPFRQSPEPFLWDPVSPLEAEPRTLYPASPLTPRPARVTPERAAGGSTAENASGFGTDWGGWKPPPGESEEMGGISSENMSKFRRLSDRMGLAIAIREVNPFAINRLREGALPKPLQIKSKSLTHYDLYLAPKESGTAEAPTATRRFSEEQLGLTAFFDPEPLDDLSQHSPTVQDGINKQYEMRKAEFRKLSDHMESIADEFPVVDGIVHGYKDKVRRPIASDIDLLDIYKPSGSPITPRTYERSLSEIMNEIPEVLHGAHRWWFTEDPKEIEIRDKIDSPINNGREKVIVVFPGEEPVHKKDFSRKNSVTFFSEESATSAQERPAVAEEVTARLSRFEAVAPTRYEVRDIGGLEAAALQALHSAHAPRTTARTHASEADEASESPYDLSVQECLTLLHALRNVLFPHGIKPSGTADDSLIGVRPQEDPLALGEGWQPVDSWRFVSNRVRNAPGTVAFVLNRHIAGMGHAWAAYALAPETPEGTSRVIWIDLATPERILSERLPNWIPVEARALFVDPSGQVMPVLREPGSASLAAALIDPAYNHQYGADPTEGKNTTQPEKQGPQAGSKKKKGRSKAKLASDPAADSLPRQGRPKPDGRHRTKPSTAFRPRSARHGGRCSRPCRPAPRHGADDARHPQEAAEARRPRAQQPCDSHRHRQEPRHGGEWLQYESVPRLPHHHVQPGHRGEYLAATDKYMATVEDRTSSHPGTRKSAERIEHDRNSPAGVAELPGEQLQRSHTCAHARGRGVEAGSRRRPPHACLRTCGDAAVAGPDAR